MAFSQLWQKFFWLYIHLKSFDEPFCPRNPDSECRIVADVAGLALFTQIQLVLRLPRHRRIDHNLGNTGNVRIHKSGNGQICYWKIPQIHNSLKLFLTELNQCHSHAFLSCSKIFAQMNSISISYVWIHNTSTYNIQRYWQNIANGTKEKGVYFYN